MSEFGSVEGVGQQEAPEFTARVTLVTKEEGTLPHKGVDKLEIYKVTVDLLKGLAWPVLLLFFFAKFQAPIQKIANQLPDKFSRASKVSFGNVTLETIQEKAREAGLPDIAEKLGKLSPEAVGALLSIAKNTTHHVVGKHERQGRRYYTLPRDADLRPLFELQDRGFLRFTEDYPSFLRFVAGLPLNEDLAEEGDRRAFRLLQPLSSDQEERLDDQSYSLTKQGEEALDSVIQAVAEQLSKREAEE